MNTRAQTSDMIRLVERDAKLTPTATYRGGFFDQIYAAWMGNPEPIWILGGLYSAYQILIGLRSDSAPYIVWSVFVLTCLAVLGRRRYLYGAVSLILIAIGIAAYGGDVALALLAAYILTFSSICQLDSRKALGVGVVLGVGVAGAAFYEDTIFDKTFLIPAVTIFVLTSLTAVLMRMRANSIRAKQKEQVILAQLRESESQARANKKAANLAATLHDSVGHSLTAVITLCEALATDKTLSEENLDMVELMNEYARSGLRQTRTLITSIARGEQDQLSIHNLDDIKELTQGIEQLGIRTQLSISPNTPATGTQIQWAYRIIQEASTNTLKHATKATEITVHIGVTPEEQLTLAVTDDGQQTTIHEQTPSGEYGLAHLSADLTSIGGSLIARSNIDGGWIVQATIPKEPTHA